MDDKYNDQTHNNQDKASQEETENTTNQQSEPSGITQNARQTRNSPIDKPKKHKTSHFFSALLGGVIAAIAVALVFTTMVIPAQNDGNHTDSGSTNSAQPPESTEVTKTISGGDADTAENMDEASDAVVGVTRMEQMNMWESSEKSGTGSGIIYKKEDGDAYVVTNHHVVADAREVEVALNDDEQVDAEILGSDKLSDLAVLKIDGSKVDTVANLGSSEDMEVGKTVIAIGNPLGMEFANTLTKGIVSGLNRSVSMDTSGNGQPDWVTEVIQTDAAINPGNSGGALVNTDGEVIGINSMKIAQTAVEGLGFAIPIDSAKPMIKQLEEDGDITRPFIGVSTATLNQVPPQYRDQIQLPEDVDDGMVVAKVESGSPADSAGLEQFDVITEIDGNDIEHLVDLRKYLYTEAEVGDSVELTIYRDGEPKNVSLELVERQEN